MRALSRVVPFAMACLLLMAGGCESPPPTRILQLAELNTEEIVALDPERTAIILPIGILEQHGPFLPSYSDGYAAERLTGEISTAIAKRPGWTAVVFPMIPLGNGGANQIGQKWIYPGSYTVRAETLRAIVMDLATEFGEQGFRWIILVTLHGAPNHHRAIDQAADFFHEEYGGDMVNLFGLWPVFEARAVHELPAAHAAEDGFAVHAGLRETSDVLFHRPDLVAPGYRNAKSLTGGDMADLVRLAREDDWPGYFGAPRLASTSFGAVAWQSFAEKARATVLAILDGDDYRSLLRYADVADQDPATLAVNLEDAAQDDRVAAQHGRWLESKGLR